MNTHSPKDSSSTLYQLLSDMSSVDEIAEFLELFMSEKDLTNMAKRVLILKGLDEGASYEQLQTQYGVSSATVSAMAQIKDLPIGIRVIERIQSHDFATSFLHKVSQLFKSSSQAQSQQIM